MVRDWKLADFALVVVMAGALTAPSTITNAAPSVGQISSARRVELVQSGTASSSDAPHIDSLTLYEERISGRIYIAQEFAFHSPKGNATTLHFQVVRASVQRTIPMQDGTIIRSKQEQQNGTTHTAHFGCGRFQKNYSVVKRATIIGADGEHSNSVDYTVTCNLALTS